MRKPAFSDAKTKTQISFAVTAKLISTFVLATRKVQSLFCLNLEFQVSRHLLQLYSLVCVRPGRKSGRPVFSQQGSYKDIVYEISYLILHILKELFFVSGRSARFQQNRRMFYCCPFCDKKFDRSYNLSVHERIHTGEKPYSCKICGKLFVTKGNMKSHQVVHINTHPVNMPM